MLGNIIILFAALFAVIGRYNLDPGIVGLSLTYATNSTSILNRLINITSQVETSMVSVERIKEYQDEIAQEAPYNIPKNDPPKQWPQNGAITFHRYMTRYREGLDLALKDISFNITVSNCPNSQHIISNIIFDFVISLKNLHFFPFFEFAGCGKDWNCRTNWCWENFTGTWTVPYY